MAVEHMHIKNLFLNNFIKVLNFFVIRIRILDVWMLGNDEFSVFVLYI
jgi:hypothetical protein